MTRVLNDYDKQMASDFLSSPHPDAIQASDLRVGMRVRVIRYQMQPKLATVVALGAQHVTLVIDGERLVDDHFLTDLGAKPYSLGWNAVNRLERVQEVA